MINTIILWSGKRFLTNKEYENFNKGDCVWGIDSSPKELMRWSIDEKELAMLELKKYRCVYDTSGNNNLIEEFALEFCECDEDGEFVCGSDYELADEA